LPVARLWKRPLLAPSIGLGLELGGRTRPTLTANWNYPTAVRFGSGRISEHVEVCAISGIKKPLVTDAGLSDLAMIARAVSLCRSAGLSIAVFDGV
jgi:hypothetical protein